MMKKVVKRLQNFQKSIALLLKNCYNIVSDIGEVVKHEIYRCKN